MKFRDFVEFAKANVVDRRATFTRADDDWPITVVVDHPGDDEPHAFDLPGWIANSTEAKRFYTDAMGMAARVTKPTKIAFISSTWQVEYGRDEPRPDLAPSQDPRRFEAVIVVAADAEIEEGWTARIKRRRYGPPLLGEWTKADEVSGPVMDPWRDALR